MPWCIPGGWGLSREAALNANWIMSGVPGEAAFTCESGSWGAGRCSWEQELRLNPRTCARGQGKGGDVVKSTEVLGSGAAGNHTPA